MYLEGGGVQEVADFLLAERLLDQQAEEHRVTELPEVRDSWMRNERLKELEGQGEKDLVAEIPEVVE